MITLRKSINFFHLRPFFSYWTAEPIPRKTQLSPAPASVSQFKLEFYNYKLWKCGFSFFLGGGGGLGGHARLDIRPINPSEGGRTFLYLSSVMLALICLLRPGLKMLELCWNIKYILSQRSFSLAGDSW